MVYAIFAGMQYFTLTGRGLLEDEEAKEMIKDGTIQQVVDVRTKLEWDNGHYKDAVHIPVTSINKDTTRELNKDENVLVYCNTGQRARVGAEKLRALGFQNVYYIGGSYTKLG